MGHRYYQPQIAYSRQDRIAPNAFILLQQIAMSPIVFGTIFARYTLLG